MVQSIDDPKTKETGYKEIETMSLLVTGNRDGRQKDDPSRSH